MANSALAGSSADEERLEYRSSDDAWYDVDLLSDGDRLIIKYRSLSSEFDEVYEPGNFKTVEDVSRFRDSFRTNSLQVQDDECRKIVPGIKVCAASSFADNDLRYFDAIVEKVNQKEHFFRDEEEQCLCSFTLSWQNGPNAGLSATVRLESLCLLRDGPLDQTLVDFVRMARMAVVNSSKDSTSLPVPITDTTLDIEPSIPDVMHESTQGQEVPPPNQQLRTTSQQLKERKRKKRDGKDINSSKKNMPQKGPPAKKAKEVTYHTSTQTYKVGGCALTNILKEADASGEKSRQTEEAVIGKQQSPNIDFQSANNDDDFEDNNLHIVLSNGVPKDHQNIPKPKKPRYSGFETRSTPKPLTDCVMGLNKDQRLAVASMGLEAMLHLNMNMVRADLAEWVLESYDSKTSTLITDRGDVHIVPKDVHFILGLPLGGRNIKLPGRTNADSPLVQQFRRQYGGPKDSTVTCKTIVDKIQQSGAADDTFKLNFLVLFFSSMVESTKSGVSNQRIMNGIEGTDDIRALNWCEYIYNCLRDTKDEWEGNRRTPYNGPITFLIALYIDMFEHRLFKIERQTPAIKGITDLVIAKRIKYETKKGGFSKGTTLLDRNDSASITLPLEKVSNKKKNVQEGVSEKKTPTVEDNQNTESVACTPEIVQNTNKEVQEDNSQRKAHIEVPPPNQQLRTTSQQLDQDTCSDKSVADVSPNIPGRCHYVLAIENMEKDISTSTVTKFIHKETTIFPEAHIFPSLKTDLFTRGILKVHTEREFKKLLEFLENPNHVIVSSRNRPWVVTEMLSGEDYMGTTMEHCNGMESNSELKVICSGTDEYLVSKEYKENYTDFNHHQKLVLRRLAFEEVSKEYKENYTDFNHHQKLVLRRLAFEEEKISRQFGK